MMEGKNKHMRIQHRVSSGVQTGFTIVEVVIVVVLLGVLLTVGLMSFTSSQNRGKKEAAIAVADKVKLALSTYYGEKDRYPQAQSGASGVTGYLSSKGDSATATEFSNTAKYVYTATTAAGAACSDTGTNKCEKYVITVKKETWSGDVDIMVRP